jgi:putative exosortase-associated protein (TIGR04073 family)
MNTVMRKAAFFGLMTACVALVGCAGPEKKLGRGLRNATEFARGGDIRRSMEQTALWDGTELAYTTGFIRGFNRSMARTAIGVYEIVTFPFPSYDPLLTPESRMWPDHSIRTTKEPYGGLVLPADTVYPDSYKPRLISDSMFDTDTGLGFSGGDVIPFVPGSRFRIFDNN